MSGTDKTKREQLDTVESEQARDNLERAESGDTGGAGNLDAARKSNPAGVEAVEQEAADGPEGLGLAR